MGGGRYGGVVRTALIGLVIGAGAQLFAPAPALADQFLSPMPVYNWYFGAGAQEVHHTGFVPNKPWYNMEKYEPGAKAYVGYRFNDIISAELGFDYLGSNTFDEGFPTLSTERSFAITGTALFFTPPMSQWPIPIPTWGIPVRAFARGGLAYKNIHQTAFDGTFDEGILSFVVGAGAEFEFSPRWFVRAEYEFISTAVGGPCQPFTALNGLFTARFGGTQRVVNAMHTELAVSAGMRF